MRWDEGIVWVRFVVIVYLVSLGFRDTGHLGSLTPVLTKITNLIFMRCRRARVI